jgi:hypothetical protein
MRYKLSSLGASSVNTSTVDTSQSLTRQDDHPMANMTTYLFALRSSSASSLMAKVVVFDVAVVDGVLTPLLGHDVALSNETGSSDYVLVLHFPSFNRSLFYDPSLGLGQLIGAKKESSYTGGGSSSLLLVGAAVAVPVAVIVVVAVSAVGWWVIRRKRRMSRALRTAQINSNMYEL